VAPEPLDLQAAMRFDAGAYAAVASLSMQVKEPFNVGAAMYFVNRTPDSDADAGTGANDCVPPLGMQSSAQTAIESEAKAAFQNGVQTYFVVLDNDAHNPPLAFFNKIQSDVQGVTTLDATSSDPNAVLGNFAKVVTALGTCSYEVPPGLDTTARLKFTNPLVPIDTSIGYDPSCDAAHQSTANGWNFDGGRVRICGCACQGLRDTILAVTAQALQQQMQGKSAPVPDVPVTATMSCQGAEAGAPSGGGNGTCSTADAGGPGGGNDATLPGSDASGPVGGDDGASGLGSGDTGAGGGQDAQVMDAGAVADSATE
jgi:hypothetical protein